MKLKFEYELSGLGWADGFIEIDKNICYFTTSYLTNALDDFLHALLYIIPNCVPDDVLKQQTIVEWYAEPGGIEWTLSRVNNRKIHIKIVSYSDMYDKQNPETVINSTCRMIDFVEIVVKSLDTLIKTHGIVGYKDCWYKHDFPLSSLLKLKNFCMTRKEFIVTEYIHKGCDLKKTMISSFYTVTYKTNANDNYVSTHLFLLFPSPK